ncbi:MAG: hypothetical protein OXH09_17060 [Gammaproteobacteria bacterium]|nr:hypothetical protein [Gammaproteobacteria bacterium]
MPRPFYTAPSPQAVRDEAKRIAESQAAWSDETVQLIRNLDEFSGRSAREVRVSRISRALVQHALALEYGASDWQDLIFLCETMEHDDFTQFRNRARFLVEDHSQRRPVAAVRTAEGAAGTRRKVGPRGLRCKGHACGCPADDRQGIRIRLVATAARVRSEPSRDRWIPEHAGCRAAGCRRDGRRR